MTGSTSAEQVMRSIMNKPPTEKQAAFLAEIARGAPKPVSSDDIESRLGWTSRQVGGVHSKLSQWIHANCSGPYPWQFGDGRSNVAAWYQMTSSVARIVKGR